MNRLPLLVIASVVFGAAISQADDAAAGRCQAYDRLRRPFFGDLHVHTASSIDAFVFDVVNTPRDAYAFARGGTVAMTPIDVDHQPTRTWKLRRPLDFTAVTDHSEGFGITKVCTTPVTGGVNAIVALDIASLNRTITVALRGTPVAPFAGLVYVTRGAPVMLVHAVSDRPSVVYVPPVVSLR